MSELRLDLRGIPGSFSALVSVALMITALAVGAGAWAQDGSTPAEEDFDVIDSAFCADCHEASLHGSAFADDLSHSVHDGLDCLDCHVDKNTVLENLEACVVAASA